MRWVECADIPRLRASGEGDEERQSDEGTRRGERESDNSEVDQCTQFFLSILCLELSQHSIRSPVSRDLSLILHF